jgi:hypothetical protein
VEDNDGLPDTFVGVAKPKSIGFEEVIRRGILGERRRIYQQPDKPCA